MGPASSWPPRRTASSGSRVADAAGVGEQAREVVQTLGIPQMERCSAAGDLPCVAPPVEAAGDWLRTDGLWRVGALRVLLCRQRAGAHGETIEAELIRLGRGLCGERGGPRGITVA